MIAIDTEQGTQAWMDARAGVPTASNFDKIVTTKGEPSKQREKYMFQLAAERIVGKSMESFQSDAMARGVECESEARALYEMLNDCVVDTTGVCFYDESMQIGASPDGMVGADGLIEIKCPQSHTHVGYLIAGVLPTDYFQQVQGQMYVTGRKWVDFLSYYPGMKPFIVRVERDEKFISALDKELKIFLTELDEITERIR
jgi:putative phage-type endonuclease